MADLDAFFKKKEEKKKKKKKGVMDINSLAENLQKAVVEDVKNEEEDAAEKNANQEEFRNLRKPGEDSEWHDYVEPTSELLEGRAVKALDYDEKVEAEEEEAQAVEAEAAAALEPHTAPWARPTADADAAADDNEESNAPIPDPIRRPEPEAPSGPKGYIPPSRRLAQLTGSVSAAAAPDLHSEELFPTLDVAEKKEKEIQAEMKKLESMKAGGKAKPKEPAKESEAGWTNVSSENKYRPGAMRAQMAAAASGGGRGVSPAPPMLGTPAPSSLPSAPASVREATTTLPAPPPATNSWRRNEPSVYTPPAPTPAPPPAPSKPGAYVPPSRRQAT